MHYFFLYLFTSSRVPRVHHPALESLRTHIPAVLPHSKAPSTVKTYHGCFKRWKSWASGFPEVTYFPAQEEHVALYLISLVQSGSSYSSIQQAFYSMSFFHNACGVSNPCKSAFLLAILAGCKRVILFGPFVSYKWHASPRNSQNLKYYSFNLMSCIWKFW